MRSRSLRYIRIAAAIFFLLASVAYFLVGYRYPALSFYSVRLQIIPSLIATSVGMTLFWLAFTLILGRIYCGTICPIGTLQDGGTWLRRKFGKQKTFRYKHPYKRRFDFAIVYLICLLVGIVAIPLLIEPWNMFRNIMGIFHPSAAAAEWLRLGIGSAVGIIAGVVSLIGMLACGFFIGRDFCNAICPIGILLGLLDNRTIYHIEIDPDKCSGCMRCEEFCRSSCIKVVSHFVDNSRCVKCFDCIDKCPDEAIRYQPDHNRPRTPLFRRVQGISNK